LRGRQAADFGEIGEVHLRYEGRERRKRLGE
jgi:hypothetical protein